MLGFAKKRVEVGAAQEPVGDDGGDPLRVADVRKRIGIEKQEIREFAGFQRSESTDVPLKRYTPFASSPS